MRQCTRLRKVNEQDLGEVEMTMKAGVNAPTTMAAAADIAAFFLILHKFVLASRRFSKAFGPMLNFIQEARSLFNEPDINQLKYMVQTLFHQHIAKEAPQPLPCLSDKMRDDLINTVMEMITGGPNADAAASS